MSYLEPGPGLSVLIGISSLPAGSTSVRNGLADTADGLRMRVVLDSAADLACSLFTGQAGDQVQSHVDASGDSGAGEHVTVIDESGDDVGLDGRVDLGEQVE